MTTSRSPRLSVLIVIYNMRREAPRTIHSALPPFQKGIAPEDYEVLILDNGSSEPLDTSYIEGLGANVRYLPVPFSSVSPTVALNWGARQARAPNLLFCIDGARILSDRLIERGLSQLSHGSDSFVYTLGWHLGPDVQNRSVKNGYSEDVEDALLAKANWKLEPDRLFEISVFAGSSGNGPFGPISESNAFFITRELFGRIGGYDERFEMPGGSLCNLEMFERCVAREDGVNVLLMSEGTFHQVHGGAATSDLISWDENHAEYRRIMGRSYRQPNYDTLFAYWPRASSFRTLNVTLQRLLESR